MKFRISAIFLFLSVLTALHSCDAADSVEYFVPSRDAQDGIYAFNLEMTDSLTAYDVSFYTRVDADKSDWLCLDVLWRSPSGKTFSETVYMKSGGSRGAMEPYRRGLQPVEQGSWKLEIKPVDPPRGLRGMGVVCKNNGSR